MINSSYSETEQMEGSVYLHGVFIEVFGKGILITGVSGIGKSDAALGLLDRGHALITDDITFFQLSSSEKIIGTCPSKELKGFLAVKSIGLIEVAHIFGTNSVKAAASLDLICELVSPSRVNHVEKEETQQSILNIAIPKIFLPAFPGRNIPLLIEMMVRV